MAKASDGARIPHLAAIGASPANSCPIENLIFSTAPIPGRSNWRFGWRSGSLHCAAESTTV